MNSQAETLAPRNILEAIRMMRSDLRKSDRKVADIVLGDPHRILNATVAETAEIAEIAEVSQPTVIRFCSAIGSDGFQDFKIRLAQSLVLGTPATQSAIDRNATPDEVAAKIFDYTMTSLDWARRTACRYSALAPRPSWRRTSSRNSRCWACPAMRRWTATSN